MIVPRFLALLLILAVGCSPQTGDTSGDEPEPLACSSAGATCARVQGEMGPLSFDFTVDSQEMLVARMICDPEEGSVSFLADEDQGRRVMLLVPDQGGALSFVLGAPPVEGPEPARADFAEVGSADMQVGTWAYAHSTHELIYGAGTGSFAEFSLTPGDVVSGEIVVTSGLYKDKDNRAPYSFDAQSVVAWPGEVRIEFRGPCQE